LIRSAGGAGGRGGPGGERLSPVDDSRAGPRRGRLILALGGAVLVAALAAVLLSRRGAAEWRLRIFDDFSRTEPAEHWVGGAGSWEVRSGVFRGLGPGDNIVLSSKPFAGDVRIELDVCVEPGSPAEAGDVRVYIGLQRGMGVADGGGGGYVVSLGHGGRNGAAVLRNGVEVATSAAGSLGEPGRSCRVVALKAGGRVSLSCDGEEVISYRDAFELPGDGIGFGEFGTGVSLDNISVHVRRPRAKPAGIRRGDRLMMEGEAAKAVAEYAAAAAGEGRHAGEARFKEALALSESGKAAEAAAALESLRGGELWPKAAAKLAAMSARSGDIDGAARIIAELGREESPEGRYLARPLAARMAVGLRRTGRAARATQLFKLAEIPGIGLAGGAEAMLESAKASRELGRPEDALARLAEGIRRYPGRSWQNTEARTLVGTIRREQGRYDEAMAAFDQVRKDGGASRWSRDRAAVGAARALRCAKKTAEAAALARTLADDPAAERYWRAEALLELALAARADVDDVYRALRRVRDEFGDQGWHCARSSIMEGRVARARGTAEWAARILAGVADEHGGHKGLVMEAKVELARIMWRWENKAEAIRSLEEIMKGKDVPPEAAVARSWASAELALMHIRSHSADEAGRVLREHGPGELAPERFWRECARFLLDETDANEFVKRCSYPLEWKALAHFYVLQSGRAGPEAGRHRRSLDELRHLSDLLLWYPKGQVEH